MIRAAAAGLAALAIAAAPAAAVPVPTFIGHTTNFLTAQGFEVGPAPEPSAVEDDQPISAMQDGELKTWNFPTGARAAALPGKVFFSKWSDWPDVVKLADRYGTRGRMPAAEVDELETVLHEMLHQIGLRSGWYAPIATTRVSGETLRWWEEGIVEAVAQDQLPVMTRALYGQVTRPAEDTSYWERVRSLRQLSVFATWPGKWRDSQATAWRAKLIKQDYTGRAAMLRAAYRAKARIWP